MNKYSLLLVLISALAFVACNGGEGVADEKISVAPLSINAPAKLSSQTVELCANCHWILEIKDAEGNVATWVEAGKSEGSGDARIALKILANKFKAEREAKLVFCTSSGKTAELSIIQEGDANSQLEQKMVDLRVGTFNIRQSNLDKDTANDWATRRARAKQAILDCDFDFFGVQECDNTIQSNLKTDVGDIYTCKFFSPYSQNGIGDKAHGLLYKTALFELSDWHYFWLSTTPDVMSENDKGTSGNFKRGACCGVLTHKQTGVKIFVMVSHGCLNRDINNAVAYIYAEQEARFNTAQLPSFFLGDLNSRVDGDAYKEYIKYWLDTYNVVDANQRHAPVGNCSSGTYNGWTNTNPTNRLDYLFIRGDIAPSSYTHFNKKYDNLYPSDHYPVYGEFTIKQASE